MLHTDEINELAGKLCEAAADLGRDWSAEITVDADDDCPHATVVISETLSRGRNKKLAEITIRSGETTATATTNIWGSAATVRGLITSLGMEII